MTFRYSVASCPKGVSRGLVGRQYPAAVGLAAWVVETGESSAGTFRHRKLRETAEGGDEPRSVWDLPTFSDVQGEK